MACNVQSISVLVPSTCVNNIIMAGSICDIVFVLLFTLATEVGVVTIITYVPELVRNHDLYIESAIEFSFK